MGEARQYPNQNMVSLGLGFLTSRAWDLSAGRCGRGQGSLSQETREKSEMRQGRSFKRCLLFKLVTAIGKWHSISPTEKPCRMHLRLVPSRDIPSGPVVKILLSSVGSESLIPGQRAKIPHSMQSNKQIIKEYCNKFNKGLIEGLCILRHLHFSK